MTHLKMTLQHHYFSSPFCYRRPKGHLQSWLLKEITRKYPFIISCLFVYFVCLLRACVRSVSLAGSELAGQTWKWILKSN